MRLGRWHAIAPALLLAAVSWTVAVFYVAQDDWLGAGDLRPFGVWCLLAAGLAYPAIRSLEPWAAGIGSILLLCVGSLAGLAFGIGWSFLAAMILGGWIGAFSFPVFVCWVAGSVVGFLASAVVVRHRVWPGASALAVAVPVGAAIVFAWLSQAPPDAIVYFTTGTTREQVADVWNDVLSVPTEAGTWPLDALQSMATARDPTRYGIRLSFRPGTSEGQREAILSRARSATCVDEIVDIPPPTRQ